jgi:hypothetical protein
VFRLPYRGSPPATTGYRPRTLRTALVYAGRPATVSPEAYLWATGALIDGQSAEMLSAGQAELLHEQQRSAALEAQRELIDRYLQRQGTAPTVQDAREQAQARELRHSMGELGAADARSGAALNTLLAEAERVQARGLQGPDVAVSGDTLESVNVAPESGGSVAILRGGRPHWPAALTGDRYGPPRDRIEAALTEAVREAKDGRVRPATLREAEAGLQALRRAVARDAADLSPAEWRRAKHCVADVESALVALQHPKAANYFNGTYKARGGTVADLVRHMSGNGLKFAPAADGDAAAYRALHAALASYLRGVQDRPVFPQSPSLRTRDAAAVYGVKGR